VGGILICTKTWSGLDGESIQEDFTGPKKYDGKAHEGKIEGWRYRVYAPPIRSKKLKTPE
jgi:hypothetical protein